MDKLNFLPADNYPLSSESLDVLQSLICLVGKLTNFGGVSNYILTGCIKTGNNYSDGIVVIAGELFELKGDVAQSSGDKDWIYLEETFIDVQVYNTTYPSVQTLRTLSHGLGSTQWAISDFVRIPKLIDLQNTIIGNYDDLDGKKQNLPVQAGSSYIRVNGTIGKIVGTIISDSIEIPSCGNNDYDVLGSLYCHGENTGLTWWVYEKTYTSFRIGVHAFHPDGTPTHVKLSYEIRNN